MNRRELLRWGGVIAAAAALPTALALWPPPPGPESCPSPRVKGFRDAVSSFPNGYFITGDGALVIEWGVADHNGNATFPYVFPHTIVGAEASSEGKSVPLMAVSNSSIKTAPGAQWVVYGY